MRSMLAPLSPNEETTLRRIGFGAEGSFDPLRLRRLLHLELVEWNGWKWQLTAQGHARHAALVVPSQALMSPSV